MFSRLSAKLANTLLHWLFLAAPQMSLDERMISAFENLLQSAQSNPGLGTLSYDCPYPKYLFLHYVVTHKPILLHGSNWRNIEVLEPRPQTDFNGRPMTAVFASGDGIWPIFFATLDHSSYRGSLRNGCFVVENHLQAARRYYFFSLNKEYHTENPWCDGMIYLLPSGAFKPTSQGIVRFDEWASETSVKPLAKLPVSPQDFPFQASVAWHDEKESITTSWLRFKKRQAAA